MGTVFFCCFFRLSYTGYSLGLLPPPDMLTCVAVAPMAHQSTVWTTAPTCAPAVTWAVAPTSAPQLLGTAMSTPPVPLTQPLGHPQHLIPPPEPQSGGLILSPAGEVLPRKLVEKIRSQQFVEMKELLFDNIFPSPTN